MRLRGRSCERFAAPAAVARRTAVVLIAFVLSVLGGCASGSGAPAGSPGLAAQGDPPAQAATATSDADASGDPRGALVRAEIEHLTSGIEPIGNDPATLASLRHHAERLWAARKAQDWAVAYDYRDVLRAFGVTREQFVTWSDANEPFGYEQAKILDVQMDGFRGWVHVQLTVRMRNIPNAPVRDITRWERWLHEFGRWAPIAPQDFQAHQRAPAERILEQEPALAARFQQWWDAVYAGDWDALYEFTDPEQRSMVTLEQFREARAQLSFKDHQVEWLQVAGDQGVVRCHYMIKLTDPSMDKLPPKLTTVSERWALRDGQWYHRLPTGEEE